MWMKQDNAYLQWKRLTGHLKKMCPLTFEVQICSFCTQAFPSTNWTIIRPIQLWRFHFPLFCSTWSNLLAPSKLLLSPSKQIVQQNPLEIIAHQSYLNCECTYFALETLTQSNLLLPTYQTLHTQIREALISKKCSFFEHCSKGLWPPPPFIWTFVLFCRGCFFMWWIF